VRVIAQPIQVRGGCGDYGQSRSSREPRMKRILIVEDNELNRDVLSRRLAARGYDVSVASDGSQGMALATAGHPDLILMDLGLPDIDGWECVRRLRANPATRMIPVVALTAHAMTGDRERALEAGCDEFDTKPIDFAGLLIKMNRLLDRTSTPSGPGR
jgi:two-component system, cell cycle response regulator DivK